MMAADVVEFASLAPNASRAQEVQGARGEGGSTGAGGGAVGVGGRGVGEGGVCEDFDLCGASGEWLSR